MTSAALMQDMTSLPLELISFVTDSFLGPNPPVRGNIEGNGPRSLRHLAARALVETRDSGRIQALIEEGDITRLKYLLSRYPDIELKEEYCEIAIKYENLEMLKFLRSLTPPCPWGIKTCNIAAYNGNIDILRWLRSQNPPCPWDDSTVLAAVEGDDIDTVRWLIKEGCPSSFLRKEARNTALLKRYIKDYNRKLQYEFRKYEEKEAYRKDQRQYMEDIKRYNGIEVRPPTREEIQREEEARKLDIDKIRRCVRNNMIMGW